jgi:hypothetical protein
VRASVTVVLSQAWRESNEHSRREADVLCWMGINSCKRIYVTQTHFYMYVIRRTSKPYL